MKEIAEGLNSEDKIYYIADSSFYSEENINDIEAHTFWITRVPATIEESKELLKADLEMKPCEDERYSIFETKGYQF